MSKKQFKGVKEDETKMEDQREMGSNNKNYKQRPNGKKPSGKRGGNGKGPKNGKSGSVKIKDNLSDLINETNSPLWYNKNARLIADATKVPFGYILGQMLHMSMNPHAIPSDAEPVKFTDKPVFGICTLHTIPGIGIARDANDGVNIATSGIYQYVRKNLSTYAQYAPADIMMYVLGIDSIITQYANIVRMFALLNTYSAGNLYIGADMLKTAYGLSADEIMVFNSEQNNLRAYVNNLVQKAATLYMPIDFTLTQRHAWLYSNYFRDADINKSQFYIHALPGYHILDEKSSKEGTMLKYVEFDDTEGNRVASIISGFANSIEQYRNSDSMMKIAADMRRAFEGHGSWSFSAIPENMTMLPTYSEDVLMQIHNTEWLDENWQANPGAFDITQSVNKNIVLAHPNFQFVGEANRAGVVLATLGSEQKLLNTMYDEVTSDDILEMTRGKIYGEFDTATKTLDLISTGVDLCVGVDYYYHQLSRAAEPAHMTVDLGGSELDTNYVATVLSGYSTFDWAPQQWVATDSQGVGGFSVLWPLFDVQNYAYMTNDNLKMLNSNILMSMFEVPELGEYTPSTSSISKK